MMLIDEIRFGNKKRRIESFCLRTKKYHFYCQILIKKVDVGIDEQEILLTTI